MAPRIALVITLAGYFSTGATAVDITTSEADRPKVAHFTVAHDCFVEGKKWAPINMEGQIRSSESSPKKCQERCASVSGCAHFSYWKPREENDKNHGNGGCHLQDEKAHAVNEARATSGPPKCPTPQIPDVPELPKATCDSYKECPAELPVNKGKGVQCTAAKCDTETCCEANQAQATCDSFTTCPEDVPLNKGSAVQCSGDTASCDIDTCCEEKATCDRYTTACPSDRPINKGDTVECVGNAASCDSNTCCEAAPAIPPAGGDDTGDDATGGDATGGDPHTEPSASTGGSGTFWVWVTIAAVVLVGVVLWLRRLGGQQADAARSLRGDGGTELA